MTWLPVKTDGRSDRDAVLGLHPDVYALHRAFLAACDAVTNAHLVELCRARMAQLLRCREELALHSQELLTRLDSWYKEEPSFSDLERAALAFVEQFIVDPALVTRDLIGPLEEELGTMGVINFTSVLSAHEASLRLSTLFDFEPAV